MIRAKVEFRWHNRLMPASDQAEPPLPPRVAEVLADRRTWTRLLARLVVFNALPAMALHTRPAGPAAWIGSTTLVLTGLTLAERIGARCRPEAGLGWLATRLSLLALVLVALGGVQLVCTFALLDTGDPRAALGALAELLEFGPATRSFCAICGSYAFVLSVPLGISAAITGFRGSWSASRSELGPLLSTHIGLGTLIVILVEREAAAVSALPALFLFDGLAAALLVAGLLVADAAERRLMDPPLPLHARRRERRRSRKRPSGEGRARGERSG